MDGEGVVSVLAGSITPKATRDATMTSPPGREPFSKMTRERDKERDKKRNLRIPTFEYTKEGGGGRGYEGDVGGHRL